MSTTYIGIDPGAKGALAYLDGDAIEVIDLPYIGKHVDALAVFQWLRAHPGATVVIEEQTYQAGRRTVWTPAGPREQNVANLKTVVPQFRNYGGLVAVLRLVGHRWEEVTSIAWKKYMKVTADKKTSIDAAERLWPNEKWGAKDGRAEAALIAEYGRRQGL